MRSALVFALLLACSRGPEPAPLESEPETPEAPTAEAPAPSAMMPPGHPPADHPAVPTPNERPPAPTVSADAPELAGVRWAGREPLTWREPSRPMRNGEYVVEGEGGEAVLTVFHFPGMGGDLASNLERWKGQFQSSEGGAVDAEPQTRTVSGLEVHTLDVEGTFAAGMMGPSTPQPDHRLLGAIVRGPNGPVFFKLVGPSATVAQAAEAFEALVASLEPTE